MTPHADPPVPVLHVSMPTVAGVPTVLLDYVTDQVRRGWPVTVACPADGWLADAAKNSGASVVQWQATREPGPSTLAETRSLRRLITECAPAMVHLHSAKAGLAGRLALHGEAPTVFQPHGWSFLAANGPLRMAATRWERLAARWTDALLCVSRAELRIGESNGVRARSRVIPNGIACEVLRPATSEERWAAREQLNLPSGPLALCIGRLCVQKGQADLLDAWDIVRRSVPNATLAIVGGGPSGPGLRQRLDGRPDVMLAGERDDVPRWLAAADVVAVPSRWEGMALVPLEAMARGRSVVATDTYGMAEAIPPDAGAIVPVGARVALAHELAMRLTDRARADLEGVAGRRHVERHHDRSEAARDVVGLYREVLRSRALA